MGLLIVIGGETQVPLASVQGWAAVREWSEGIDPSKFPELTSLVEHGISQRLSELESELTSAISTNPPHDGDTFSTLTALRLTLSSRDPNAESAFVSDGIGGDNEQPEEWGGISDEELDSL